MARPDPLLVLVALVEARARLWQTYDYTDLEELMRPLYRFAKRHRLKLGTETIDEMMLTALGGKLE